jgi:hypothetical protein
MILPVLSVAAALALTSTAAAQAPVAAGAEGQGPAIAFTGHTAADAAQARDAMDEVARFSGGPVLKCADVTGVEASAMPEGWQPADPNFRIGPPGTRYERWSVAQCGKVVPFLIAIWTDPKYGAQIQVAHPFPADPAPAPRP